MRFVKSKNDGETKWQKKYIAQMLQIKARGIARDVQKQIDMVCKSDSTILGMCWSVQQQQQQWCRFPGRWSVQLSSPPRCHRTRPRRHQPPVLLLRPKTTTPPLSPPPAACACGSSSRRVCPLPWPARRGRRGGRSARRVPRKGWTPARVRSPRTRRGGGR